MHTSTELHQLTKRAGFQSEAKMHKEADWVSIMNKAKRLIQSGQVQVLRNGFNYIVGHIIGDHGEYDTEVSRDSPDSRTITGWQCSCPWDQYAWQRCVMMGSMISLADGTQKPVEEIRVGDVVIDHMGSIGFVSEIHVEDWQKEAVTLRATGFDPITVKPDHPVWGVESDQVKCRNKSGSLTQRGGTRWRGFCALETCGCRNPRQEAAAPSFRWAQDFEVGDYLVRPHLSLVVAKEVLDLLPLTTGEVEEDQEQLVPLRSFASRRGNPVVTRQQKAAIPRQVPLDHDLMRLLGYYVAEGMIAHYSVRFCFHREELEYHEDVRRISQKVFGATVRDEGNGPNALNVSINNREIAAIFRSLFSTGAEAKSLPQWLMFLPLDLQESFIEGWFRGDGHQRSDGRRSITTTSPNLAHQLELLLQRQGFTPGLIHEYRSLQKRPSSKENESDAYTVYWVPSPRHNRGVRFSEGGNTMVRIEEVIRAPFDGKMYDLTITGNPGYLVNGFSVHNTRKWKKFEGRPCSHVMALYWKALSTPLDEQLTEEQANAMGTGQKLPAPAVPDHPPEIQQDIMDGEKHQDHLPRSFGPEGDINQGDQTQLDLPPDAIGHPPGPAQAPLAPPPSQGPEPPGILPPFPGEQMQMQWAGPGTTPGGQKSPPGAYSVPGAKPPGTPPNPIQGPGTFSHIAGAGDGTGNFNAPSSGGAFQPPQVVRLKNPVMGLAEGPEKGQYGDGEYREVPAGKPGEVMSQDPSTGWVEVIVPLDDTGYHAPFHVRCFVEPSDIEATGQTNAFIRRRSNSMTQEPEDSPVDSRYWVQGGCGEYACALHDRYPYLQFGRHVETFPEEYDPEWDSEPPFATNHVFLHDDSHAYDSLGKHPPPFDPPESFVYEHPENVKSQYGVDRRDIEGEWDLDPAMIAEAHRYIDLNDPYSSGGISS